MFFLISKVLWSSERSMYVRGRTMAIPHPNWTEPSLFKAVLWGILMAVPEGAALGMGTRGRGGPESPQQPTVVTDLALWSGTPKKDL